MIQGRQYQKRRISKKKRPSFVSLSVSSHIIGLTSGAFQVRKATPFVLAYRSRKKNHRIREESGYKPRPPSRRRPKNQRGRKKHKRQAKAKKPCRTHLLTSTEIRLPSPANRGLGQLNRCRRPIPIGRRRGDPPTPDRVGVGSGWRARNPSDTRTDTDR
ncbi:hypothetical protein GWI33_021392 [Rhynchophorus ferrugineus]|uniref:Uncharacterized protein n=1 Tax=Rhynchophorus ferrugineus TaxID=354439 RepID=A0A834M4V5_RHYFE|nr:hypothetical protein GWI33_021392 [Rhynchophorus ferrugineus]